MEQTRSLVTNRIRVFIESARSLRKADWMGKSDPYCVCVVSGKPHTQVRTDYIKSNLNPEWNHEAIIEDFEEGDSLEFSVWDRDPPPKKDELLGDIVLHSSLIGCSLVGSGFSGEVQLLNTGKAKSFLKLSITFLEDTAGKQRPSSAGRVSLLQRASMNASGKSERRTLKGDSQQVGTAPQKSASALSLGAKKKQPAGAKVAAHVALATSRSKIFDEGKKSISFSSRASKAKSRPSQPSDRGGKAKESDKNKTGIGKLHAALKDKSPPPSKQWGKFKSLHPTRNAEKMFDEDGERSLSFQLGKLGKSLFAKRTSPASKAGKPDNGSRRSTLRNLKKEAESHAGGSSATADDEGEEDASDLSD